MRLLVMAAAFAVLAASTAHAQDYPTKPVHVIVPFTAGSATDVVALAVAQALSIRLGQPFVVENKPGASSGTIGAAQVAKSSPDGYTLLVHSSGHTVNPAIFANLTYDTAKDLVGVSLLAQQPNILVACPRQGLEDRRRSRQGRERTARQDHLRVGRHRQRHPLQRREVQAVRRHRHAARALSRHAGSADRHDQRPGRLFLRAGDRGS